MIVKTVFIVKMEQLPIEENVNIVRWIVKIYKVNHHNIEKKTNKTTDLKLTISAIRGESEEKKNVQVKSTVFRWTG